MVMEIDKQVDEQVERISIKLQQAILYFGDKGHGPFGAEVHQFRVKPPLALSEIEAFEARFEVTLPLGYRMFLLRIGNGGAGPAYGLFSLDRALSYQRPELPLDILKTSFPHIDSFDDSFWDEVDRQVEIGEISESEADRMMDYETAGTIVLCHEGCGHLHRLVISGPSRGEMWMDSTCSDQGYFSLQVNFLDWYERWLDQVLNGKSGTWWFSY